MDTQKSTNIPHPSSLNLQPSSLFPAYHWRGARPHLLDLNAAQSGWAICLVLNREGDCCLLPVAWLHEQPDPEEEDPLRPPYPIAGGAFDEATLQLTIAEFEQEGWEVTGRLDATFTGRETDPHFQQHLRPYYALARPGGRDGV